MNNRQEAALIGRRNQQAAHSRCRRSIASLTDALTEARLLPSTEGTFQACESMHFALQDLLAEEKQLGKGLDGPVVDVPSFSTGTIGNPRVIR